jgi:hypothetical protein
LNSGIQHDLSVLAFSLSSHRHSYKSLFSFRFIVSQDKQHKNVSRSLLQQIGASVSFPGFSFTFIGTIIISILVPGRSRAVQKLRAPFATDCERHNSASAFTSSASQPDQTLDLLSQLP